MLDIKVLGTGCAECLKMEQLVIEVLQALGIHDAHVELVSEQRMIEYGLLGDRAPGLLINGKLAWAGSVPTKEQLTGWLRQALVTSSPPETVALRDGTTVTIRPIHPDDAPRLEAFFARLSPETIFSRFLEYHKELPQKEVERLVNSDYHMRMALVAARKQNGDEEIVAVASYDVIEPAKRDLAEVAIVTEDRFRSWGLGTLLMNRLAAYARRHGIRALLASVHHSDDQAIWLIRHSGLPVESRLESGVWEIRVNLEAMPVSEVD